MTRRLSSLAMAMATLLLLLPAALRAQVQSTAVSIQGEVHDPSGSVVPDAAVEAVEVDTSTTAKDVTDKSGRFNFPSLKPGNYIVKVAKDGFSPLVQRNLALTVGRAVTLKLTLAVGGANETLEVTSSPLLDVSTDSSSNSLGEVAIQTTPVLGRKFEDLLTLTPGVSITQGPDGDEININGQRGIFNNISLDGGDYNNGFFGEQVGGQRAAVDITLEAVKEFQVVAAGANPEFGRTAGGVVNVITKSGTNTQHGSAFYYQRAEGLSSNTSDGQPLRDFDRRQYGGSYGGAFIKDKLFGFIAGEGIYENLTRLNLGQQIGSTPCPVANPVFRSNITETQINANGDCQRLVLVNYYKSAFNENEGTPVSHQIRNGAVIGRIDWNINPRNLLYGSYNFDYSRNPNQTFDVQTYGRTANGIEGTGKVSTLNVNFVSTLSDTKLNEAHVTYAREDRGRAPIDPTAVPDTGIGFSPSFRFGQPFFLGPGATELFYRYDLKDAFSYTRGKHSFKFGAGELFSHNTQIFDGFALGRYIFSDTVGFLHYATPASMGSAFGPNVQSCSDGSYSNTTCPAGTTSNGSPLLLYLQDLGVRPGVTVQQAGYSDISNHEIHAYAQDTWKATTRLTVNYGIRWESQIFPDPVIPPSQTAYGVNLTDPRFPSTGYLPNQLKEFQPRVGFTYDIAGNGRSVVRASWGIFNARQNMLTQVGAITTNGAQQQTIFNAPASGYPNFNTVTPVPAGQYPGGAGVTVFDRNYHNPRIYNFDIGYEQQVGADYVVYADFADSKGVYLTRFTNPNVGPTVVPAVNSDTVSYTGTLSCPQKTTPCSKPFPNLGDITNTISNSKSLYRGVTIGLRKRMSHGFLFDGNYVYSVDKDDDSNERDPFTFRYANLYNLGSEYANSDRDERHKFNFYTVGNLPFGFKGNLRIQVHSAQPETDNLNGDGTGAPCSYNNSLTRFVNGIDCGRNHLRKDNAFSVTDFGIARPIHLKDRFELIPRAEVFNLFNSANNINPLSSPQLFDFDGFIRLGVGDPRQAQLSLRLAF